MSSGGRVLRSMIVMLMSAEIPSLEITQVRWGRAMVAMIFFWVLPPVMGPLAMALSGADDVHQVTAAHWVGLGMWFVLVTALVPIFHRATYRIEWSGDGEQPLRILRRHRDEYVPWQSIRDIQEDQRCYHLYSQRDEVSISKAGAPADLLAAIQALAQRLEGKEGACYPARETSLP